MSAGDSFAAEMVLTGRHANRQEGFLMAWRRPDRIALYVDGPNRYATAGTAFRRAVTTASGMGHDLRGFARKRVIARPRSA